MDTSSYPQPLAQRPFWMPPSSPGGLKPRYPPASSQVKDIHPSPLRKLRRSVVRIAKAADNNEQSHCAPRPSSVSSLEDSELPYARLRDSVSVQGPSRLSEAPPRSSSIFDWQRVMPSSSSTLSDAGYAAQASRGRPRQLSGRIQLTDQDILETGSNTLVDYLDDDQTREFSYTTTLPLGRRAVLTSPPNQLRHCRPMSPSPLIDTSRTDIAPDDGVHDEEADQKDELINTSYGEITGHIVNPLGHSSSDNGTGRATETADICQLRSSHTFGPGTRSAFAPSLAVAEQADNDDSDTSLEVIELSCFALTTPSDEHEQAAVHLDQAGIDADIVPPAAIHYDSPLIVPVDSMPDAVPQASIAQATILAAEAIAADGSASCPGQLPYPRTRMSSVAYASSSRDRKSQQLQCSHSYGFLTSPPVSSAPSRSPFVPRLFLLARAPKRTSGTASTGSPNAPRALLLDKAGCSSDLRANARTSTTSTSLGLGLLQLARSSVSSSSTSLSGLMSPPLSLAGYIRYSPPQSPDWAPNSVFSNLDDRVRESRDPMRKSSYIVLPASLSTLTARSGRRGSKAETGSLCTGSTQTGHPKADAVQETFAILDGKKDVQGASTAGPTHVGAALYHLTGSAL